MDPEAVQALLVAAVQLPQRLFNVPVRDLGDQQRLLRGDAGLGIADRQESPNQFSRGSSPMAHFYLLAHFYLRLCACSRARAETVRTYIAGRRWAARIGSSSGGISSPHSAPEVRGAGS